MQTYGLQLYSVRDITETDLLGAMRKVADIGYGAVEFAGFFGVSAADVKSCLDECGLVPVGTHVGMDLFEKDMVGLCDYHLAIGCRDLIIPWSDVSTAEKLDAVIEGIKRYLPYVKERGMRLHYHNHDHEFVALPDGRIPFFEIAEKTGILLEVDTFWVYAAGYDPIGILERYADRITLIHLKDGEKNGEGHALGEGTAPVARVHEYAVSHGLSIIVESEGLSPSGLEEVTRCMAYLKTL